jgi:hypothetical protein
VAVLVQAVVGLISLLALRLFDGAVSGAIGLIAGVCAAPALLIVGAPFGDSSRYPAAVGASALLWFVVGFVAARRATRSPVATWNDYWRHFAWLCAGVWVGAILALGLAGLAVSESLI